MKIAHVGNIANNAYLNAKFQRRYTDIEADSYDYGVDLVLWHPAWEDALFDMKMLGESYFDWTHAPFLEPWERPPWAKIMGCNGQTAPRWRPWYETQAEIEQDLPRLAKFIIAEVRHAMYPPELQVRNPAYLHPIPALVVSTLLGGRLTREEVAEALSVAQRMSRWEAINEIANHYDLVVLYGPLAANAIFLPRSRPYITFEHGTMRHLHTQDEPDAAILRLAYCHADCNIITNADCQRAAAAMGLAHYRFIPHSVDEQKFSPGDAPQREQMLRSHGVERIFFAPARHVTHDDHADKQNERIVHAFARYVAEAEPKGAPKAMLLFLQWGRDARLTEQLCRSLELTDRIRWTGMRPKRLLVDLYRMADIVLDQFGETVGSFGTITVEALACGKPVITHINAERHEWCRDVLPELPPVAGACTVDEIYAQMVRLATDESLRAEYGARGREWVEQYHSSKRVAELHQALYEEVLA